VIMCTVFLRGGCFASLDTRTVVMMLFHVPLAGLILNPESKVSFFFHVEDRVCYRVVYVFW
jgi:hypothetical protein